MEHDIRLAFGVLGDLRLVCIKHKYTYWFRTGCYLAIHDKRVELAKQFKMKPLNGGEA